MSKRSLYVVCKTLDQPIRIIGLPLDEFILMSILSGTFFVLGKFVLSMIVAVLSIILMRIMKRGQGSGWLINACYWHLPAVMLKVFLRFTPESHQREWIS